MQDTSDDLVTIVDHEWGLIPEHLIFGKNVGGSSTLEKLVPDGYSLGARVKVVTLDALPEKYGNAERNKIRQTFDRYGLHYRKLGRPAIFFLDVIQCISSAEGLVLVDIEPDFRS